MFFMSVNDLVDFELVFALCFIGCFVCVCEKRSFDKPLNKHIHYPQPFHHHSSLSAQPSPTSPSPSHQSPSSAPPRGLPRLPLAATCTTGYYQRSPRATQFQSHNHQHSRTPTEAQTAKQQDASCSSGGGYGRTRC